MNYEKAIWIDSEDEVLNFNLARAHLEQGNRENAAGYLKTALRLKPDFPEAHFARGALLLPKDYRSRLTGYLVVAHQTGGGTFAPDQNDVFDAILDGWRVIHFPDQRSRVVVQIERTGIRCQRPKIPRDECVFTG